MGFCVCSALSFVTVNLKTLMLTDFREFPNTRVTNKRHNALIHNSIYFPPQYKKMDSNLGKLRKRIFEIINFLNNVSH